MQYNLVCETTIGYYVMGLVLLTNVYMEVMLYCMREKEKQIDGPTQFIFEICLSLRSHRLFALIAVQLLYIYIIAFYYIVQFRGSIY